MKISLQHYGGCGPEHGGRRVRGWLVASLALFGLVIGLLPQLPSIITSACFGGQANKTTHRQMDEFLISETINFCHKYSNRNKIANN